MKVETVDGSNSVTGTVGEYIYDGEGTRIKKETRAKPQRSSFRFEARRRTLDCNASIEPHNEYTVTDQLGGPRVIVDAMEQKASTCFLRYNQSLPHVAFCLLTR